MIDVTKFIDALEIVEKHVADKVTKDNVTIYRVGNVIRIDIKEE